MSKERKRFYGKYGWIIFKQRITWWLGKVTANKRIAWQTVVLDFQRFHNCQFYGCTIVYAGNKLELIDCHIDGAGIEGTAPEVIGYAANALRFLQMFDSPDNECLRHTFPNALGEKHDDGLTQQAPSH